MSNTKEIGVSDLHQGDVMVFSPDEEDTLSRAIAWVTDSTVSHAAMVYYSNDEIAEETLHGLVVTPTKARVESQRMATVLRLKSEIQDLDMKKVVDVAAKYVNNDEPYATADLLFLAIYFLFKKCSQDTKVNKALAKIIKLAMMALIEMTDEKLYPGKDPMQCSQFVYHCYREAGPEYRIILKKEQDVKKYNLLQLVKEQTSGRNLSYKKIKKDLIKEVRRERKGVQGPISNKVNVDAAQKAAKELLEALQSNNMQEVVQPIQLDKEFMNLVQKFCILLTKSDNLAEAIEKLVNLEEFFVSPGDLLSRTENLEEIGVLTRE